MCVRNTDAQPCHPTPSASLPVLASCRYPSFRPPPLVVSDTGSCPRFLVVVGQLLKRYVAYAKAHCHPTLTLKAARVLQKLYLTMRNEARDGRSMPITMRQLESLVRLSQVCTAVCVLCMTCRWSMPAITRLGQPLAKRPRVRYALVSLRVSGHRAQARDLRQTGCLSHLGLFHNAVVSRVPDTCWGCVFAPRWSTLTLLVCRPVFIAFFFSSLGGFRGRDALRLAVICARSAASSAHG